MKVLFIGNSHTFYNDMPHTFAKLLEAGTGEKTESVMIAQPAVDLEWHVKSFFNIRYNLMYGDYDYCIVQQQAHPFPGKNTTKDNILKILEFCKPLKTKLIVTQPWAKKDRPQDQELLNQAFQIYDQMEDVLVSPVGEIWMKVKNTCQDIELYAFDGAHASAYGDYLLSCVHYAVITGMTTKNLPYKTTDFLQGAVKCPDNSGVINDIHKLTVTLDSDKCDRIHDIIDTFLNY